MLHHDELVKLAEQQQQKTVEIEAARGTIFDRTGQPLAKTLPAESICINPMKIPDAGVAADLLSRVLDLKRKPLYDRIAMAKVRNSGFLWVKRKVSAEEAERVRSLQAGLGGIPPRDAALLSARRTGCRTCWDRPALSIPTM